MMQTSKIIAVAAALSVLAGCTGPNGQPGGGIMNGGGIDKQDVGTVAGAVGGGVLGSMVGRGTGQVAATIVGGLLGGAIGNSIGKSLDNADMAAYNATSQKALETAQPGQTLPWQNPESGNSGTVTPSNYYQNAQGQYCREYSQTVTVGGRTQQAYGKACRQPDGSWQITQQ
ncbi:MAG: glycine zipper 2TM domain-containing protein [Pseudomonadota bacterium]|nr:glycine zipper 2TM domain-containing protein [Pseudomonadota bacterium]MDE3036926.1 glycine zipper 2TM domain-containing protein [Pseudomonadota bacterium]